MFAPPPVQLTREQVERLKEELQNDIAKKQQKKENRKSVASGGSGGSRGSLTKIESNNSLERADSKGPKKSRISGFLSRSSKPKVSSPIPQPTSPIEAQPVISPKAETPGERAERKNSASKKAETQHGERSPSVGPPPPVPVAASPRKSAPPPMRPLRPRSDLFAPDLPGAFPGDQTTLVEVPEHSPPPPPVPVKSSRRRSSPRRPQSDQRERKGSYLNEKTIDDALAQLDLGQENEWPAHLPRASTAPTISSAAASKPASKKPKRATFAEDVSKVHPALRDNRQLRGVQGGKIDKSPKKRLSATSALEATLMELEYPGLKASPTSPRRSTESDVRRPRESTPPRELQMPWKRRRKGETLSMLVDNGFFPIKEVTMHNKNNPNVNILIPVPAPLALMSKELPATPDSIMPTPTELYPAGPMKPLPAVPTHRKVGKAKRSPLGQVSFSDAKANSGYHSAEVSPSGLTAIPELSSLNENSPPESGVTTPVATQIHLRGGSVVTVTPPELTAWQRHLYIQGPIKFPKPAIMPRKNSVASLEAFQDAIDQVYQIALAVPRRRSDDAIVDDVCEWLDDFGFDEVKYDGDVLMVEDIGLAEVDEADEVDSQDQRFSTPPPEQEPTPLEKAVAKEVADASQPSPMPKPPIPPVENEETLRARGIARLSHHAAAMNAARKDSLTVTRSNSIVTPVPEESMLPQHDTPPEIEDADTAAPLFVDQGGMDWDDDVEELGHQPFWVAPATSKNKQAHQKGMSIKEGRNPVLKMRRLMATASAML